MSHVQRCALTGDPSYGAAMPDLASVVAANVRAERARHKWRQRDLAERLGVTQSTVSDIESGQREVPVGQLAALCRALDIPLTVLLRGADREDLEALGL